MNKKILFGMLLLGSSSLVIAQNRLIRTDLQTEYVKPATNPVINKAVGEAIFHENFDSTVTINAGVATKLNGFTWTIDATNSSPDPIPNTPNYGWVIDSDANGHGWTGNVKRITSTSGNKYAMVNNGVPSPAPGTQWLGVVYTLTSDPIDIFSLSGGVPKVVLQFEQFGAKFYDRQEVQVSVDGTNWVSVYDNGGKGMLTSTGGSAYPNPDLVEADIENAISGDASAVRIRFRWTTDVPAQATNPNVWVTYGWRIDDVKIVKKSDNDLVKTYENWDVEAYKYSQIPLTQATQMDFSFNAGIKNQGMNALNGIKLDLSIAAPNGNESASSSAYSLNSGDRDTVVATYTPSDLGNYEVTPSLSLTEVDDNLSNNGPFTPVKFTVTDYLYAADAGSPFSQFPRNGLSMGGVPVAIKGIGTSYDIFADQDLTGITFRLYTGTTVGAQVSASILEINPNAGTIDDYWIYIDEVSAPFEVTATSQAQQFQTLVFDNPITLEAGKTYLAYLEVWAETVEFAAAGENDLGAQAWLNYSDGVGYKWGTFTSIPVIRLNFDPTLSVEKNTINTIQSRVYPNPTNNETTVSFNLKESANVSYTVTDLAGNIVATVDNGKTMAGKNEITIDASSFANGVYFIKLNADNNTVTHKLIVNK
ncbi:MAG: T9SS type A sorting domain-containing protein [Brumimicrobium sp.]|nr:T9SS type A sorting domain-containing protein [Brumimicrobium sp.]